MKSLGNFPDPFIAEISGQPDALRRAARGLGSQAAGLDWLAREAAGRTVVFTGMGSSYDACYPALNELAAGGIAALMIDSAELLHFRQAMLGERAFVVAVSQSGESAEIMRLAYELRQRAERPLVAVITNGLTNSLARMADVAFDTFVGTETGPSTMTFAASLVLLSAISRILSGASGIDAADMTVAQVEDAASSIERLLVDGSLPERLSAWLGDRRTLVILGRGPARAAAEMGALTIKEAAGLAAESLETAQFRHGPLELSGPDLAAVVIATEPETIDLDVGLAGDLVSSGTAVLLVTPQTVEIAGALNVHVGGLDRTLAPAVSIVPTQLLAWSLASRRGRAPGAYHRASKVTTRE